MARDGRQLDFVIKLRLIHSAGLKIVNKEVVPSLFVCFCHMTVSGKV